MAFIGIMYDHQLKKYIYPIPPVTTREVALKIATNFYSQICIRFIFKILKHVNLKRQVTITAFFQNDI